MVQCKQMKKSYYKPDLNSLGCNKDGFVSNDSKLEMCFCNHIIFNIHKYPGS